MTNADTGYGQLTTRVRRFQPRAFHAVLVVYLVVTLALTSSFQYSLYLDGTSYISIAQAYARGQFWDAVNGYWSPLYCWLLAPLLAAGIDQLLAPKLLALLIGVLTLMGLRRLCRRLALADVTTDIVPIAAVPLLVCWSLTFVTPDFLLVAVLTWYLSEVVGWSPSSGARTGFAAGALAGIASLTKQYALPFVATHLALAAALHFHRHRTPAARAALGRWLIAAYVVWFAVAAPWAMAMSAKYDRVTVAAAGTYNWYLLSTGFNVGTRSLAPPPFPGAASAWVDPTPYAHTAASIARTTGPPAERQQDTITAALFRTQQIVGMLERFSFLALVIVAAAGVLAVREARRKADYRYAQLLLALALYIGGYQAVTAWLVERLVWIVAILLGVLGALVFERLATSFRLGQAVRFIVATVLALSFSPLPMLRLAQEFNEGREVYATALMIERAGVHGRLASLNRYADSLRVAFFTGSSYYGRIASPATIQRVLSELRSHQIDFLLIWPERNPQDNEALYRELRGRFPDLTQGSMNHLSVLDVRAVSATGDRGQ